MIAVWLQDTPRKSSYPVVNSQRSSTINFPEFAVRGRVANSSLYNGSQHSISEAFHRPEARHVSQFQSSQFGSSKDGGASSTQKSFKRKLPIFSTFLKTDMIAEELTNTSSSNQVRSSKEGQSLPARKLQRILRSQHHPLDSRRSRRLNPRHWWRWKILES